MEETKDVDLAPDIDETRIIDDGEITYVETLESEE